MSSDVLTKIKILKKYDDKLCGYTEKVNVLDFIDMDIQGSTGYIKINAKGHELVCFIKDMDFNGPFFLNEKSDVLLSLMTYKLDLQEGIEKYIKSTEKIGSRLVVSGIICKKLSSVSTELSYDLIKHSYILGKNIASNYIIVDCGIFIKTLIPHNSDFNIGDHIYAIGRLDIEKYREGFIIGIDGKELTCFVNYSDNEYCLTIGNEYNVEFSLMPEMFSEIRETDKKIQRVKEKDYYCELCGVISGFAPFMVKYYDINMNSYTIIEWDRYKKAIVDCGIFVSVAVPKYSNLKIGDYVKAIGRLDIKNLKLSINKV